MTILKKDDMDAFRKRFDDCDDGVIRSVEVIYPYGWYTRPAPLKMEKKRVNIVLSVRDYQSESDWCNLIITISDVREVKIGEPHDGYHSVLSDGLKLGWFDDLVFVDFSLDENDLKSAESFRRVHRYVSGREAYWRVEPYDR